MQVVLGALEAAIQERLARCSPVGGLDGRVTPGHGVSGLAGQHLPYCYALRRLSPPYRPSSSFTLAASCGSEKGLGRKAKRSFSSRLALKASLG